VVQIVAAKWHHSTTRMHASHVSSETWLWQIVRVVERTGCATIHRTLWKSWSRRRTIA